jgi:hypothetical protein
VTIGNKRNIWNEVQKRERPGVLETNRREKLVSFLRHARQSARLSEKARKPLYDVSQNL